MSSILRGGIAICLSAFVTAGQPARVDPPQTAPRFGLELYCASGGIRATFSQPGGRRRDELRLRTIRVDGQSQSGFTASAQNPAVWSNATLLVEIEPIGPASAAIRCTVLDGGAHDIDIAIEDNSAYYGCGERFASLNHKGLILPIASIDRPEDKGSVSYKPVPFYMSTRGYAAWLDSAAPATFDFNATDRELVLLRGRATQLRLVLIDGPDLAAMLNEFTQLTGRPRVPPAWAFAPWKSRNIHQNREEVLADAELTRQHDLPGSVIVIDSPWETGYNDFALNERQFREPEGMFARLRELGFHPCLWLTPFINLENVVDMAGIESGPCPNFADAAERGYLVRQPDGRPMIAAWWKGKGALVDFTNPAAVAWWHGQLDQTRRWGVRAFKCDDGEGNFVQDAVFFDGTSAAEMKNRYAALYLRAAQAYIDSRMGGDGVLLARCGFTGTQGQPFCWAGDNEASFSFENGLPTVVLAGQNAALSGLPLWGHDIAGYIGTPSKELFIRWTQFGAVTPLMQVHMTSNLGPWDVDEQTLSIYRTFAKLHMSLFPYIYDAAHEASRSGLPIIRPMVLAFPHDPEAAAQRYQYLFGPDLLVAPMIQPGRHRSVYLPRMSIGERSSSAAPGNGPQHPAAPHGPAVDSAAADNGLWIDYWTGERYRGGQTIEAHAPLERMPLFVRGGALIATLPDDVDTLLARRPEISADVVTVDDRRILQVWSGGVGTLTTYDGITAAVSLVDGRATLRVSAASPRTVEVRRMFAGPPQRDATDWTFQGAFGDARRTVELGAEARELAWHER